MSYGFCGTHQIYYKPGDTCRYCMSEWDREKKQLDTNAPELIQAVREIMQYIDNHVLVVNRVHSTGSIHVSFNRKVEPKWGE